jgi:hypothetical protein
VTNVSGQLSPAGLGVRAEADLPLVGAPMAMPYYSFGNKFGRITKE